MMNMMNTMSMMQIMMLTCKSIGLPVVPDISHWQLTCPAEIVKLH